MNRVIIIGRLTKEPDIRYTDGLEPMAVARFILAVNRKYKNEDRQQSADFINCVAFGKNGEFIERYCTKGTKLVVEGRIQTGSYTNKEGRKVYTTDVVVEGAEFAESKANSNGSSGENIDKNGFMTIHDGVEDEGLPFLD